MLLHGPRRPGMSTCSRFECTSKVCKVHSQWKVHTQSGPACVRFSNVRPGDPRNTQTCAFSRAAAAAAASSLSVTYPRSKWVIRIWFHSTDPTCKQTRTHPPVNTESSLFLFTSGTVDLRTFLRSFNNEQAERLVSTADPLAMFPPASVPTGRSWQALKHLPKRFPESRRRRKRD